MILKFQNFTNHPFQLKFLTFHFWSLFEIWILLFEIFTSSLSIKNKLPLPKSYLEDEKTPIATSYIVRFGNCVFAK